ncbi:MAG: anthranilate synthase subunit [Bacillota bacterium]|jgi:anthranilate synthase/aminodeoxychorismate synthase-like glutamine amidotransferase|nr:anthranilate synthase subunit [Bacillota bacterium]
MYLIIDNYDSFVYNLAAYFHELGQEIIIYKNDKITKDEITKIKPQGIIISPGPKSPTKSGMSEEIVKEFYGKIPILGVCLGHQVIGHVFGSNIVKGVRPMHGKITAIKHNGKGLFHNIPSPYFVTRYHSLIVDKETLSKEIQIDAEDDNSTIMAISHRNLPVYGVQFHPEAVLSEYGHEILNNFIKICENWWCK